ncbi:transglycosylase domain-containing protein [Rugosimonospora africana]|uniref:transglycosylase domain-containing protein n=1 Tax=Rugosimonospora africana TaxID=556532 RepID=UPI001940828D|nr:transglycosylase domain-containing protein [Rugosimonospora africana]
MGSASVGGSPAGRATVGRASVGPDGSGPGGPGGPNGPGRGRAGAGGAGGKKKTSKRTRRRNIILAAAALLIMMSGVIVVGGTYYFDSVKMPDALPTPAQSTTIYYADGQHQMAKIGDQNRTNVGINQIPKYVQDAVVAAEDNTFYTNQGVDFRGIMRALVNNVTGGDREGASTITQQYARKMADLEGISYARKLREAVIAMKLTKDYSKAQILNAYLNTVYFGRGAYGIEAASQAYFHKSVSQLTPAEGILIAGVIKQPEPADLNNPSASPGYDPAYGLAQSKDRWGNYILPNMVKLKFMSQADASKLTYPTDWVKPSADTMDASQYGLDLPTGFILHQVMAELSHQTDVKALANTKTLKTGGYKIITTIDYNMEQDAIKTADDKVKGSVMSGQPTNLQASLVTIEPSTGRVKAYFGGHDGSGLDYAGIYDDPVLGDGNWTGAHFPPGSTFKLYTLATALSQGISIDSYWNGAPKVEFPDQNRTAKSPAGPVTNADGAGDSCPANTQPVKYVCTLQMALQKSMNTVFFGVGDVVHASNIIDMAKAMGIEHLWAPVPDPANPKSTIDKRFDLANYTGAQLSPKYFGNELSIGQYGTTVLDNATGVATLAARGISAPSHFVEKVYQGSNLVYEERLRQTNTAQTAHLTQQEIDDETWAMQSVIQNGLSKNKLAGGREAAAKTGTWQYGNTAHNQDGWYAGFTPQLATVVHIGSRDPKNPIVKWKDDNGNLKDINGADLPGTVWKTYMDLASKGMKKVKLPDPKHVGDATKGNEQSPQPQAPPPDQQQQQQQQQPCLTPPFCPGQGDNGGRGHGGNNNVPPTNQQQAPPNG